MACRPSMCWCIYIFTGLKTYHYSYSIYKHNAIDIAEPSSMQDACRTNFVIDLAHRRVSVAHWYSIGARNLKVCGSIPHRYSEFFLCPTLVTSRKNLSLRIMMLLKYLNIYYSQVAFRAMWLETRKLTTRHHSAIGAEWCFSLDYDQSKGAVNENSEAKTIHNGENNLVPECMWLCRLFVLYWVS